MNEQDINLGGFTGFAASDDLDLPTPAPTESHDEHEHEPAEHADMHTRRQRIRRALLGVTTRQKVSRAIAGSLVVILACVSAILLIGRAEALKTSYGEIDTTSALQALEQAAEDLSENGPGIKTPNSPAEALAYFIQEDGITTSRGLVGPILARGELRGSYAQVNFTFTPDETGKVHVSYDGDFSIQVVMGVLQTGETLVRPDGKQALAASTMNVVPPRIETLVEKQTVERVVYKDHIITKTVKPKFIEKSSVPVTEVETPAGPVSVDVADGVDTSEGPQVSAGGESIFRIQARINDSGLTVGGDEEEATVIDDASADPAAATLYLNGEALAAFPEEAGTYAAYVLMDPAVDSLRIDTSTTNGTSSQPLVGTADEQTGNTTMDAGEGVVVLSTGVHNVNIGERDGSTGAGFGPSLRATIPVVQVTPSEVAGMRRVAFHLEDLYISAGIRSTDFGLVGTLRDDWSATRLVTESGSYAPVDLVQQQRVDLDPDLMDESMHGATTTQVIVFEIPVDDTIVTFTPQAKVNQTRVLPDFAVIYSDAFAKKWGSSTPPNPEAYAGMSQQPWEHTFYPATLGSITVDLTKKVQPESDVSNADNDLDDDEEWGEDETVAGDEPMGGA